MACLFSSTFLNIDSVWSTFVGTVIKITAFDNYDVSLAPIGVEMGLTLVVNRRVWMLKFYHHGWWVGNMIISIHIHPILAYHIRLLSTSNMAILNNNII